ncbi:N-acetyltransferase [Kordiimonas sediminis]|uniref:N-acetyltransferase n=1 Tax=Kordiimonas sediminis TaxID=1735581 RepID=A0A919AT63_9PROT|nr:N-acetyltransferase [Kordiimonas sediminis]GHF25796.1 N-acetyltransferase [Kordiimonas sediminis]
MLTEQGIIGVDTLLKEAFETDAESQLVKTLRSQDRLVAEHLLPLEDDESELLAYIAYTDVSFEKGEAEDILALGPMAVSPGAQRQGIGLEFLQHSLDALREDGIMAVILLGHTDFYRQAGFQAASDFGLTFGQAEEHFMAIELRPGALKNVSGKVLYDDAFYSL